MIYNYLFSIILTILQLAKWSGSKDTGFYTLPQTLADAEEQGWTKISNYTTQYSDDVVALGLAGDPRLSILFFETSGNATGAMLSVSKLW